MLLAHSYTPFSSTYLSVLVEQGLSSTVLKTSTPLLASCDLCVGNTTSNCTLNTGLMRARHNSILKRLVKAVPSEAGEKFVEQKLEILLVTSH